MIVRFYDYSCVTRQYDVNSIYEHNEYACI